MAAVEPLCGEPYKLIGSQLRTVVAVGEIKL